MPTARNQPNPTHSTVPREHVLPIMRFRGVLDWLLSVPRWEDAFTLAASELELPSRRQGISLAAALRSLRIEQKFALLRHALAAGIDTPNYLETRTLAHKLGITDYPKRPDFERPSTKHWQELSNRTQLKLSQLYSKYKDAQGELFSLHHKLPESLAHKFCRNSALVDDATQEARLALLDAIDHISDHGSFESYARHWIKRRIQNLVMRSKLPVSAPINLISKTLRRAEGANPALAKALKDGTVTLDDTIAEQTFASDLSVYFEPDPAVEAETFDLQNYVKEALTNLTHKQREVVSLRFGFDSKRSTLSLSEIASRTGISRQQVHKREKRALQRLAVILKEPARELQYSKSPPSDG